VHFAFSTSCLSLPRARLGLICLGEVIRNAVVEVLPTKVRVTGDSEHLKHTIVNRQERNIESATTEVIHDDLRLATLLVKTVCNGRGRRIVDDTKDIKASNNAGILGCLTLSVIEV
jgi:hypothetical protein